MRDHRLKRNRAVATRYDKLSVRYEATLHTACINEWPRSHVKHTPAPACAGRSADEQGFSEVRTAHTGLSSAVIAEAVGHMFTPLR